MTERWVVNASPLIVPAKIDHQRLLTLLPEKLVIPQAVVAEVNAGPAGDPARRFLSTSDLNVVEVEPDPNIAAWDLGLGETAVLSFASTNPGWRVVVAPTPFQYRLSGRWASLFGHAVSD
jgi:hypothetical protein